MSDLERATMKRSVLGQGLYMHFIVHKKQPPIYIILRSELTLRLIINLISQQKSSFDKGWCCSWRMRVQILEYRLVGWVEICGHESQLQHLLALMWNSPAGFHNHLVLFIICLNIIFVTSRGSGASEWAARFDVKMVPRLRSKQFLSPTTPLQNVQTVHSFTAGSPTYWYVWNVESLFNTDRGGYTKALSPEAEIQILLLGHQEEITQYCTVHYCSYPSTAIHRAMSEHRLH